MFKNRIARLVCGAFFVCAALQVLTLEALSEQIPNFSDPSVMSKFDDRIKNAPADATGYEVRGFAYMQLQKYPNAISALSKAIELAPTFHAYDNRAAAYGCMRDWNALIADATKATLLNPRDSISFGNRAMAYNELGQFAQAQADYLKAIHLNPSQATFYEGLGELLCKEKRYSSALEYLDRALEMNEKQGDAHYYRATAYKAIHRDADAAREFRRASALGYKPGQIGTGFSNQKF